MNLDYIKERVAMLGAKSVQIFAGNVLSLDDAFPVFTIKDDQDVNRSLKVFGDNFSGQFTAFLRTDSNVSRKSGERISFYHTHQHDASASPINGHQPPVVHDLDKLKLQWQKEFQDEWEKRQLLQQYQDLKREFDESRKPEQRLVSIIHQLSDHLEWGIFKKGTGTQPVVIQGTTTENSSSKMGKHNMDDLSEDQAEKLEDAFATIYSHLGMDLIMRVASALEKDPSLANKLSMFI